MRGQGLPKTDINIIMKQPVVSQDQDLRSLNEQPSLPSSKSANGGKTMVQTYATHIAIALLACLILETYLYLDAQSRYSLAQQENNALKDRVNELHSNLEKLKKAERQAEHQRKQASINQSHHENQHSSYMTAQIMAISQKRTQQSGMMTAPKGTVCQLDRLKRNEQGQGIQDVIYSDEEIRNYRRLFVEERVAFMRQNQKFQSIGLCKYTVKVNDQLDQQQELEDQQQFERIRKVHDLDKYGQELPMCIVVPSYNNNAKFRLEFNLNSIFLQNYSNYFAVIIDDVSSDGSDQLYRKYLSFYGIHPSKYVYIHNERRYTAMENIYRAITQYCSQDSIVINLDGDDEFIGKNVLKIFNANYQRTKMGVIYSNYHRYRSQNLIEPGWTKPYPHDVTFGLKFRKSPQYFSHLKSHRSQLFRLIPVKQFQDEEGKFFTITSDMAIYYPLMEVACGKVLKIEGYHYLYNFNTGLNDFKTNHKEQLKVEERIRNGAPLKCSSDLIKKWNQ